MELQDRYIRFDWAVKRLLRHKANFGVLEGFLTVLIGDDIHIVEILESEGNQQTEEDKFNRVDIKALNSKNEIVIIEIQNTRELYYLERILYGVARPLRSISHWVKLIIKLKRYIPLVSFISISVMELIIFIMGRIYLKGCIREISCRSVPGRRMLLSLVCLPKFILSISLSV